MITILITYSVLHTLKILPLNCHRFATCFCHVLIPEPELCFYFSSDDEELFEDAMDNEEVHFMVSKPPGHRRTSSEDSSAAR